MSDSPRSWNILGTFCHYWVQPFKILEYSRNVLSINGVGQRNCYRSRRNVADRELQGSASKYLEEGQPVSAVKEMCDCIASLMSIS